MPKLSKEAKQRLQYLFKGGQFAIRWGFIPVVLYLVCFGDEELKHCVLEATDEQISVEDVYIPEARKDTF